MFTRFVTALSLVLVSCSADNCEKAATAYQLLATLPEYCNGVDPDDCTLDSCDCSNCCELKPNPTCSMLKGAENCADGNEYDASKDSTVVSGDFETKCCKAETSTSTMCSDLFGSNACPSGETYSSSSLKTVATATDFGTKCCATQVKCDTVTTCAVAGQKLKATAATDNCIYSPCYDDSDFSECCEEDPLKCLGLRRDSCGENKTYDESKAGVAATTADFKEQCCSPLATCEAFKASTAVGKYYSTAAMKQSAATFLFVAIIGVST